MKRDVWPLSCLPRYGESDAELGHGVDSDTPCDGRYLYFARRSGRRNVYMVSCTALDAGLDNQRGQREAADDPVAHREELRRRPGAEWKFRDQGAFGDDLLGQGAVALGVDLVDPRAEHGQCAAARLQCGGVGDRVDADRQTPILQTDTPYLPGPSSP